MTAPPPSALRPSPLALDFDALEPGQRFATRARTITESDVVWFAALTGDLHPQHVDAEWAAASRFGERVAHGMLVLSYAVGLVPLDPERVMALRRVREAVFKRPARLGDTIHVEGRIDAVKPLDAATGVVTTAWRVVRQDGATVARVEVDALWRRGSPPEGAATTEYRPTTREPVEDQAVVLPL
jgi:acyl dehydratase